MISTTPSPDSMALVIKKPLPNSKFVSKPSLNQKKERPYCTHFKAQGHLLENCFKARNAKAPVCSHCHMTGHTIEKCYKLHKYPPGHKFFAKGQPIKAFAN